MALNPDKKNVKPGSCRELVYEACAIFLGKWKAKAPKSDNFSSALGKRIANVPLTKRQGLLVILAALGMLGLIKGVSVIAVTFLVVVIYVLDPALSLIRDLAGRSATSKALDGKRSQFRGYLQDKRGEIMSKEPELPFPKTVKGDEKP